MSARHTSAVQACLVDARFDGDVYPNEPLARHTSYRLGGPARFLVRVNSLGSLKRLVETCEQEGVAWTVIGRGSNLLVSDAGYQGVVITLGRDFRALRYNAEDCRFSVGAGTLLSAVVQEAFHRSLEGLEFAVGTPGEVGGALRMNAGSRRDWLGERVVSVTTYSPRYGLLRRAGSEIEWAYRSTSFCNDEIIVEAELAVRPADPFFIRGKMEGSLSARKRTQPLGELSCGSVFKSPEDSMRTAGELIDAAGCKGLAIGGAKVSDLHANFIINTGAASADDVARLIALVKDKVYAAYGIELVPEVRFLGF